MLGDQLVLLVRGQQVPAESSLDVPAPGVWEPITGAVDHGTDRVLRPAEALLAQTFLRHLEVVLRHLPLLLLLSPHLVQLLLDDDLIVIPRNDTWTLSSTEILTKLWRRPVEVCYNDWNGQSDAEDSTDGTEWGHQLPGRGAGRDIAVARAGHGDDGPVQGLGQRVEHCVRLVLLQGVAEPGEYQHSHADSHTE